jgi:hypothetical protein
MTATATKPLIASKTVLLNVVAAIAAGVAIWNPALGAVLGQNGELICTLGLATANVVLRLVTKQPVRLR